MLRVLRDLPHLDSNKEGTKFSEFFNEYSWERLFLEYKNADLV